MKSNFQFLVNEPDTQILFDTAKDAEDLYAMGKFSNELESLRKIAENVARQLLDLNFVSMGDRSTFNDCLREIDKHGLAPREVLQDLYDLKGSGNSAAHTLHKYSKSEALTALRKMYDVLVWFGGLYMDEKPESEFFEPKDGLFKTTADRKVIYVQTADNQNGLWPAYKDLEKIGDATIDSYEMDNRPNSDDLRAVAEKRINQYMKTAGVPHKLQWAELAYRKQDGTWFRDYDVQDVLERSGVRKTEVTEGNEWFKTDVETAKKAIQAVKEGRKSITVSLKLKNGMIKLRPEQKEAIKKTKQAFKKHDKMLWNAKMRFGKTMTALQLVKEEKYQHVLIMTHRPVVDEGWFEDFNKIGMPDAGYLYGSKNMGEDISNLLKSGKPYVYFASLQDLRGSEEVGGKQGDKNHEIFDNEWDLVIVDEAHEGTQTELAQRVTDEVVTEDHTKLLELSGTPFNILDQYDEDQVYTWDYVMEQQAKHDWNINHPDEPNPYAGLPEVSMYTFEMNRDFKEAQFMNEDKQSFNFKEFFRVDEQGKFVYESKVKQFLRNITTPDSKTNYPFSTKEFRNRLRHTLWILPGVKEANALEDLMKQDPVFGMEYQIVNVVRNGDDNGVASESDIDKVKDAMKPDPAKTKTITLTVRKMTTGVTIKPWTGVLFLSNTNSAMQYLQAAFRAQSAYSSPTFGQKTNCYIFDFAPDRALTVMAAASQLDTGVGKRTTGAQKEKMAQLLNFLPIIGEKGQSMEPYNVDNLLAKIKRVYAEKAVQSGFDDDSLYSDELLMLDNVDLKDFNHLQEIVGTTKAKKKTEIDVNDQGLSDEEYDTANRAKKKSKKERTPEEEAALEKMKALKKQRKTMISILRSISIRIPMMIYGMKVDINQDVDIHKFIDNVDALSWEEFMPKGVSKELFKKFIKYYDPDVFIEAGRIIRHKTKELDRLDPIDRAEKLALIFGTFRNPDKETVLTPWRVVNMHLGKTIGGYNFYDESYQYTTKKGKKIRTWRETEYTDQVFNPNAHILEINSKTGLYPLYAALSIYYQEYMDMVNQSGGKFSFEDQLMIWQRVLRENIFVVAKTPMARAITQRTLAGYLDMDTNIAFVDRIVEDTKASPKDEAEKIKRLFGNMKFDVVIGNPPYQEVVAKKETNNGQKRVANIFQYFQELSDNLGECVSLIYPGKRWIHRSGKGMSKFGLQQINDPHLAKLIYFEDASMVFKKVAIPDGLTIVFKNKLKQSNTFDYEFIAADGSKQLMNVKTPGEKLMVLNPKDRVISDKIDDFVIRKNLKYISESSVINQKLFKIESSYAENHPDKVKLLTSTKNIDYSNKIKLFTNDKAGKKGRSTWFIADKDVIKVNKKLINEWQVVVSSANAGGQKRDNQISIMDNHSAFGRSRIALKSFKTKEEAENFLKFAKSKLIRYAFLLTDEQLSSLGQEVPDLIDYTDNNQFIDYSKDIDSQLYKLFGMNDADIKYIEYRLNNLRK